jgi:hypothetical protein
MKREGENFILTKQREKCLKKHTKRETGTKIQRFCMDEIWKVSENEL